MSKTYIDYCGSVPYLGAKFHGGANYTKRLLLEISKLAIDHSNIHILVPHPYKAVDAEEEHIFSSCGFTIIRCEPTYTDVVFAEHSVIFFPLLMLKKFYLVNRLKRQYPTIKVYVTIHDLRMFELKPDGYDRYYHNVWDFNILAWAKYFLKSIVCRYILKRYLPSFDKVFTVSNSSLQQIVKCGKISFINHYYQGVFIDDKPIVHEINESFILFVSGHRPLKNFARTLKAFCNYKRSIDSDLYLYVTGMTNDIKPFFLRRFSQDYKAIIQKWVKMYDYVDSQLLNDLYKQSKFSLYTSKSEGFGLVILESILRGRPVVASYSTSIPEVAGASVLYVNPFDIKSIERGINEMAKAAVLKDYERKVADIVPVVLKRIEIDRKILLDEILH